MFRNILWKKIVCWLNRKFNSTLVDQLLEWPWVEWVELNDTWFKPCALTLLLLSLKRMKLSIKYVHWNLNNSFNQCRFCYFIKTEHVFIFMKIFIFSLILKKKEGEWSDIAMLTYKNSNMFHFCIFPDWSNKNFLFWKNPCSINDLNSILNSNWAYFNHIRWMKCNSTLNI